MKEIKKEKDTLTLQLVTGDDSKLFHISCPYSGDHCVGTCAFYDEKVMGDDCFAICGYGEHHRFSRDTGVEVTRSFRIIGQLV